MICYCTVQENGKHASKERQEKQKQKSQLKNKTHIKEPDGNVRGEKYMN